MGEQNESGNDGQFQPTRWSLILQVREGSEEEAEAALEEICKLYWFPIYTFLRRTGAPPEDAEDLTQDFFKALVAKKFISSADRSKGKLRTFLLGALKNYRSMDYRAKTAASRGGTEKPLSIDQQWAEGRLGKEPADSALTPEAAYDRAWATLLMERVREGLEKDYETRGKGEEFAVLKQFLDKDTGGPSYVEIAAQLQTSEGNIKIKVKRMRDRHRDLLVEEVRQTLDSGNAHEELLHLVGAI